MLRRRRRCGRKALPRILHRDDRQQEHPQGAPPCRRRLYRLARGAWYQRARRDRAYSSRDLFRICRDHKIEADGKAASCRGENAVRLARDRTYPADEPGHVGARSEAYCDGRQDCRVSSEDTRALFESIDTSTLIGLRDRALIGVMAYSFARIGAVLAMRVENYLPIGKVSAAPRKGRQATRSPCASSARALPRCVHRSRGPCRTESAPVLFGAAAHGSLDTKPYAPGGCVQDDPPRAKSRYRVPGNPGCGEARGQNRRITRVDGEGRKTLASSRAKQEPARTPPTSGRVT